jgi:hypothetical protein
MCFDHAILWNTSLDNGIVPRSQHYQKPDVGDVRSSQRGSGSNIGPGAIRILKNDPCAWGFKAPVADERRVVQPGVLNYICLNV